MPKKAKSSLGKSLMRRQNPEVGVQRPADVYVQEWAGPSKDEMGLNSALDMTDLTTIAQQADLAQTRFVAEKERTVLIQTTTVVVPEQIDPLALSEQRKNFNNLTIPRRPIWTPGTPLDEQDKAERQTFLQWRRRLAELEENEHLLLTPFEKNLEVWKQLWRVIERSELIVQILDARDPLLFRSPDLEKYVDEFAEHKLNILLMNKADLLSEPQRNAWAQYFKEAGIRVLFFSARAEQMKIEQELAELQAEELKKLGNLNPYSGLSNELNDQTDEESDDEDDEEMEQQGLFDQEKLKKLLHGESAEATEEDELLLLANHKRHGQRQKHSHHEKKVAFKDPEQDEQKKISENKSEQIAEEEAAKVPEPTPDTHTPLDTSLEAITGRIIDRTELFDYCLSFVRNELGPKEKITVGMVGYPNVGKSSTVNVLVEKKKVAVSATPGKTKHFQTIQVHDNITLCDCPGLVFPTFLASKAEMFCNGLLRIAEMRECLGPTSVVTRLIPRREFEYVYGIKLPKIIDPTSIVQSADGTKAYAPKAKLTPQQLLNTYADHRGFYVTAGRPDQFKAARIILNDFVDGKLLFCRAPPTMEQKQYSKWTKYNDDTIRKVPEGAPIRPVNRHEKPIDPKAQSSSSAPIDDDDGDSDEELEAGDMIDLNDPEELRRLTNAPASTPHVKPKHQRINRKQEIRRMKKGFSSEEKGQSGIHLDFVPSTSKGVRTLPTGVKLVPGKRSAAANPNSTAPGRTFFASVKK